MIKRIKEARSSDVAAAVKLSPAGYSFAVGRFLCCPFFGWMR